MKVSSAAQKITGSMLVSFGIGSIIASVAASKMPSIKNFNSGKLWALRAGLLAGGSVTGVLGAAILLHDRFKKRSGEVASRGSSKRFGRPVIPSGATSGKRSSSAARALLSPRLGSSDRQTLLSPNPDAVSSSSSSFSSSEQDPILGYQIPPHTLARPFEETSDRHEQKQDGYRTSQSPAPSGYSFAAPLASEQRPPIQTFTFRAAEGSSSIPPAVPDPEARSFNFGDWIDAGYGGRSASKMPRRLDAIRERGPAAGHLLDLDWYLLQLKAANANTGLGRETLRQIFTYCDQQPSVAEYRFIRRGESKLPYSVGIAPDGTIEVFLAKKDPQYQGIGGITKVFQRVVRFHDGLPTVWAALKADFRKQSPHEVVTSILWEHRVLEIFSSPYILCPSERVIRYPQKSGARPSRLRLVQELALCDGVGLFDRPSLLSLANVLVVVRDAARGLTDIHEARYVHRDVKPDNIFVFGDEAGTDGLSGKIADLGSIVKAPVSGAAFAVGAGVAAPAGTQGYISPEAELLFLTYGSGEGGYAGQDQIRPQLPSDDIFSLGASIDAMIGEYLRRIDRKVDELNSFEQWALGRVSRLTAAMCLDDPDGTRRPPARAVAAHLDSIIGQLSS